MLAPSTTYCTRPQSIVRNSLLPGNTSFDGRESVFWRLNLLVILPKAAIQTKESLEPSLPESRPCTAMTGSFLRPKWYETVNVGNLPRHIFLEKSYPVFCVLALLAAQDGDVLK